MTLLKRNFELPPRKQIEVEPYTALANYYNQIMVHVDYQKWSLYVTRVAAHFHFRHQTILDVACGTGKLAVQLASRGFKVTGVDGNEQMIEQARRFSIMRGHLIDFYLGDMRKKPPVNNQDLILCLYDSINYLMKEEDLALFFSAVRLCVKKDGVLIFDCSTQTNSLNYFHGLVDQDEITGGIYVRKSTYDKKNRIQYNRFEIYPDGDEHMYVENHKQKIWPILTLLENLEDHGFKLLAVLDGYTFQPGDEDSDRVHIIAKPV